MPDTCRELGVALVAYSPVGRGLLTGAITGRDQLTEGDWRAAAARFAADSLDANLRLVAAVRVVAEETGCTPAKAAPAWLLAQGEDVLPIPDTRRVRYLEENADAADLRLTAGQQARLREAVPVDAVAGERYPAAGMRTVGHWSIDRRLRTLASGPGASLRTGQGVRLRALRPDRTYGTMARWITLRCRRPPSWPTGPTGCARPPSARWSGSCCVAATPGGPPPRTATSTSTCW
ncbi:aldo/keto reductase [Micromonospora sp. HM134]|uniref:aldo/keto reductase n=1 Tax=Micromonospora sp. HM134 TaxID=2583243 RepID=UPI001F0CE3C6|nr:aldo/keto reductase [Micromonospora sp. HM134]